MNLEGAFLDLEGTLLHSLPKVGAIAPMPLVPTSLSHALNRKDCIMPTS